MSFLLVSLGTSPSIVPEAFLLPEAGFSAVHVLTTESVGADKSGFIRDWFRQEAPAVELSITRVKGFLDFQSEEDHFHYEEVLYRWWQRCVEAAGGGLPHVCLSGGFKTMSAAMQKAAAMLGAEEVFHVLAKDAYEVPGPDGHKRQAVSAEEISDSRDRGFFNWIRLGRQSGWPQLRGVKARDFPLSVEQNEAGDILAGAADRTFREWMEEVERRSHNIAVSWNELPALPFSSLATLPRQELDWLNAPLDPDGDRAWVEALPKVELHCHLGGFATHGILLREVRSAAERPETAPPLVEPTLPTGWPRPPLPLALTEYMELGSATGSSLLTDPGCLRRHCALLYRHLQEQNILHAEVRCSPANYAGPGRSPWQVLTEMKECFDQCRKAAEAEARNGGATELPAPSLNLILIATRRRQGDYRADISRHLALAVTSAEHWRGGGECRVTGVDLAGYEDISTRAHYFREEFTGVHRCGLALTVHAGENDDAEGIWRAVFDLNARRLGHALHLVDSPDLMRSVADRGVTVEMCPYANYQIKGFRPMPPGPDGTARRAYPLRAYLENGVRVTVNTDNIGISQASLTDNFLLLSTLCPGLTRMDVLRLLRNAADGAFLPHQEKTHLAARMADGVPRMGAGHSASTSSQSTRLP